MGPLIAAAQLWARLGQDESGVASGSQQSCRRLTAGRAGVHYSAHSLRGNEIFSEPRI